MASITISNLTVGYGGAAVLKNLSLNIQEGTFFTLLGPSGCGKTTLLRTLAGFNTVQTGSIRFGKKDVTHLPAHLRDVGMVFQDYALFPNKTVFENVAYGLRARRTAEADIKSKVGQYLERVGLSSFADRVPAALSGGQRQRVALARALVIHPTVLLMDEPLSNLDARLRVQVRETIADLQKQAGITTVLVTHDQEEALVLSDQIGLLKQGQLEQVGTPAELFETPRSSYVADFIGAANLIPVENLKAVSAGETATLKFPSGESINARSPGDLRPGACKLVARAELLRFSSTVSSPNVIPCMVTHHFYMGAHRAYKLRLANGVDVNVVLPSETPGPELGRETFLQFDPARTLVLAS